MYSLRSRAGHQTMLDFPCRKKRSKETKAVNAGDKENTSPEKKSRSEPSSPRCRQRVTRQLVMTPSNLNKLQKRSKEDEVTETSPEKKSRPSESFSPLCQRVTRQLIMTDTPGGDKMSKLHKRSKEVKGVGTSPEKQSKSEPSSPRCCRQRVSRQLVMTDSSPSKMTKLQMAKSLLHSSSAVSLVGREREISRLTEFLTDHLEQQLPGSLYISGPPGTGKTASLTHILETTDCIQTTANVAVVNCMSVRQPTAIFDKIWNQLTSGRGHTPRDLEQSIVKHITTSRKMIVLVLDELDQLSMHSQHMLYTVFEWPALSRSRLILIGIANALDLTDRLLPRLQAHVQVCPQLLHYPPYNKDQLAAILHNRLSTSSIVMDPMAIQFCSRKVAAVHGDARTALDICRAAIELVDTEQHERVTVSHVATVLAKVYGKGGGVEESMPLQQKLAICSLLLLVRDKTNKEVTLNKLYQAYCSVCKKRHVSHEARSEFVGLLHMIETRGLISTKQAKGAAMLTKVKLCCQEDELEHSLHDKILLSSILTDTSL